MAGVALLAAGAFAVHHAWQVRDEGATSLELIATMAFAWLCFSALAPYLHRDVPIPAAGSRARRVFDRLSVTVVVPARNEDPAMFRAMLDSISAQTRLPDKIHVVENGYPERRLEQVFNDWAATSRPSQTEAVYSHRTEVGKRDAQAVALNASTCDVYVTLDSDVILDPDAIARGLAPFADPRTTAVGGLLLGANPLHNKLTRLVELGYVAAFLNGRAAWGLLGSVGVQCGALAFYRGWVIRKYLTHYLTHTVANRRMPSGDDAMATRYALMEGRSLIQLGAVGYTLHPTNLGHLSRQRTRWWRSWWWGNVWVLRAFPPTRAIWWLTVAKFVRWAWYATALVIILAVGPARTGVTPWMFFAWLAAVAYVVNARYLTIRRADQKWRTQFGTYLLAPAVSVLNLYLCSVLRWIGLATCLKTRWNTRGQVEVRLDDQTPTPRPS